MSLKIQLVFLILIALLLTGLLCDYLYENSPKVAINISTFQRQLISKENEAESKNVFAVFFVFNNNCLYHNKTF